MASTPDHYFSAEPASAAERTSRQVSLPVGTFELQTARGVFSPDHLDTGTAVLLRHAPQPPEQGNFLDLGCGWGPIALTMALYSPAAQVYAVDVNHRAVDLTERNAKLTGASNVQALLPHLVPQDLKFDLIWSNPPIRVGKQILHEMLQHWLNRLAPGGQAYLVVQKNLGADSLARWLVQEFSPYQLERVASSKGFRVLQLTAPTG